MKKISKPLLLIVALCMWGGCKDDSLQGDGENGLTTVGTNYLAFNIVSDGGVSTRGTRAWPDGPVSDPGDFDAGEEDQSEQVITTARGSNVAILFNENNSFHSMCELIGDADIKDVGDRYQDKTEKTIGKFTANLKIAEDAPLPSKVLVVLNGNPERLSALESVFSNRAGLKLPDGSDAKDDADYTLAYLTRRLSDAMINKDNSSVVIFSPSDTDTEYCTMSNSIYLGTGDKDKDIALRADHGTGEIYNLVDIKANIQTTKEAAESSPVTVHVERLAVKVEVGISGSMTKEVLGGKSGVTTDDLKFPILLTPQGDGATAQVQQVASDKTDVSGAQKVDWAFTMLGWSTNAVARRMYLFKNLNDKRGDISKKADTDPHHNGDNGITREFFGYWNDAPHARCYWAVDGHYADPSVYPLQYRTAKDKLKSENSFVDIQDRNKVPGSGDSDELDGTQNMPLYYYSYTQMRMISMGLTPIAAGEIGDMDESTYTKYLQKGNLRRNLKYRYCGENVLGQALISDPTRIWRGASTHVVFFGQLLLGGEIGKYREKAGAEGNKSTQDLLESVSDKLYAAGCYWSRASYMQYAYAQIFNALNSTSRTITDYFGEREADGSLKTFGTPRSEFKLFYQNANGEGPETEITLDYFTKEGDNKIDLDKLSAVHDKFDYGNEDGSCNGADETETNCIFRLSAAQVSNGDGRVLLGLKKGYRLIIKGKNEAGMDMTVPITSDQFLSIAYEFAGVADYYAYGRMYYYVPIYHAATGKAATGEAPEKVGDIGVVRNHWYKLTISSLLKPGIPVSDPGQPIIPNIDPTDRYLGLEIHVLPWHVIGQQVTLQ